MNGKETARYIEKMLKAKYRVPDTLLRQLRVAYADKAVTDGQDVKMNRIYSIVCLSLSRYTDAKGDKWGIKRLEEFMNFFSDTYEEFYKSDETWRALMQKLADETGMVIRTGEEGDEVYELEVENK